MAVLPDTVAERALITMDKDNNRKGKLVKPFLILIIIAGLSLMLYPTVSDYIHSLSYHKVIQQYNDVVSQLDEDEYDKMLEAAHAYNARLLENSAAIYAISDEQRAVYESLLNVMGDSVMGYINIPKANINLPIYHGTSEEVLQHGVGHYESSSLPVGGKGVHTILSGHTGLPSSKLFTDIRELEIGDTFMLHVLNETLTYQVESIDVVLPEELKELTIEPDKDICTLLTCTPYGVNTHRLVVRAHRVDDEQENSGASSNNNKTENNESAKNTINPILIIAAAAILLGLIIAILIAVNKKRKNNSI